MEFILSNLYSHFFETKKQQRKVSLFSVLCTVYTDSDNDKYIQTDHICIVLYNLRL